MNVYSLMLASQLLACKLSARVVLRGCAFKKDIQRFSLAVSNYFPEASITSDYGRNILCRQHW